MGHQDLLGLMVSQVHLVLPVQMVLMDLMDNLVQEVILEKLVEMVKQDLQEARDKMAHQEV